MVLARAFIGPTMLSGRTSHGSRLLMISCPLFERRGMAVTESLGTYAKASYDRFCNGFLTRPPS